MRKIFKKWSELSLVLRILIGLIIGAILGLTVPQWTAIALLGTVFVNALKAIAPVLVGLLVIAALANSKHGLGPRFRTVIGLYLFTTFCAALLAVVASFLFPVKLDLEGAAQMSAPGSLSDVFGTLLTNLVANPVMAIASANYVAVLFWSVVFGFALKLKGSETSIKVAVDLAEAASQVVRWVIEFAPFGILGLVFTSVADGGLAIFTTYGKLLLLLVGCMLCTAFIVNPLIHFLLLGTNPYPLLLTCLKESGISAFFTRSSAANIPMNMALCKKLGLDSEFYSVSIPLGATINMSGAAVTITVLTLSAAHTVGIEVTFVSALILSVIAALGACGASGVAGGSLLLVPMACSFFGISADIAMQAVAVGFIIGVVQDSVETALNSSSDAYFTATAELYDRKKQKRSRERLV